MKVIIVVLLAKFLCTSYLFAEVNEIQRLGKDKQFAYVDQNWREGTECIEVRFVVASDTAGDKVNLKAYFFDSDGAVVYSLMDPSHISDDNGETSSKPQVLKGGDRYSVFFAIPGRFDRGAKKWRRCVVVLENGGETIAKVYPKDDIEEFDFPEKSQLKRDLSR